MSTAQLRGEQPQHPVPTCCYGHLVSEELQREARCSGGAAVPLTPPAALRHLETAPSQGRHPKQPGYAAGGERRAGTDPETQS